MEELIQRCSWATTDLYKEYHDNEWGKPVHDENKLFEMLILEGMQAGLSWLTILNKREAFRIAEEEITRFEECLDRIRKNLEEWQKS